MIQLKEYETGRVYSDTEKHVLNIKFVEYDSDPFQDDAWDKVLVHMDDPVRGLDYWYGVPRCLSNRCDVGCEVLRSYDSNKNIAWSPNLKVGSIA